MGLTRNALIEEISKSSLELKGEERNSFIEERCSGDEALLSAVNERVRQYEEARAYFGDLAGRLGLGGIGDAQFAVMEGQEFGKYVIEKMIGQGGMGLVYRARDTQLNRPVALKFLSAKYVDDDHAKERFMREARAAAALNHPNVVTVHEIIEYNGLSVIVMEYIEGQTLRSRMSAGVIDAEEAIGYIEQIGRGLAAAHEAGIVHRDLKPANIIITKEGRAKILDFGLAKLRDSSLLTQEGTTLGTVAYMSPEQARGKEADHRSDIWSLGVIVYEMLCGERPFKGEYDQAIIYAITNENPQFERINTQGISSISIEAIEKALTKDPVHRYDTVRGFLSDIKKEKVSDQDAIKTQDANPGGNLPRHTLTYGIIGVLLVGLCAWWLLPKDLPGEAKAANAISIAVLPLENLSADSLSYFADGMTEELISTLTKVTSFKVIPRRSVMQFQKGETSIENIFQILDVDYIIDGSILLTDNRVRLNTSLLKSNQASALWTEKYVRPSNEIITLQQDLARDIAQATEVQLSFRDEYVLGDSKPHDEKAMLLYLQGVKAEDEGDNLTAISYYEQAIDLDSTFSLPQAAITVPYFITNQWEKGKLAAAKALALDDRSPQSYVVRSIYYMCVDEELHLAAEQIEEGLSLFPGNPTLLEERALYAGRLGEIDEAWENILTALKSNPYSRRVKSRAAYYAYLNRDFMTAIEFGTEIIEGDWTIASSSLINSLVFTGNRNEVEEIIPLIEEQKALYEKEGKYYSLFYLAYLYAIAGRNSEAREILVSLKDVRVAEDQYCYDYGLKVNFAMIYHLNGDQEEAFHWLERATKTCPKESLAFLADPVFDNIRYVDIFIDIENNVKRWIGKE